VVPPDVGSYELFATWVADPSNATNATYKIYAGGVQIGAVTVNQQQQPNDLLADGVLWRSLGVFTTTDGLFVVTLDNAANGAVNADAIFAAPTPPLGAQDPANVDPPVVFEEDEGDDGGGDEGDGGDDHGPGLATAYGQVWQAPAANEHGSGGAEFAAPATGLGSGAPAGPSSAAPPAVIPPAAYAGSPFTPTAPTADTTTASVSQNAQSTNGRAANTADPVLSDVAPVLDARTTEHTGSNVLSVGQADRTGDDAADPLWWGVALRPDAVPEKPA
jgi:hypothetical protein